MMKVKGHITELTLCLEDKDSSISNSVKLFFHELSKKGNWSYNDVYSVHYSFMAQTEKSFCAINGQEITQFTTFCPTFSAVFLA